MFARSVSKVSNVANKSNSKRLFATLNHSEAEMKLFASHSSQWWNTEKGPFAALHDFNHMRVPFICEASGRASDRSRAFKPLVGASVLDVGCGGGILAHGLAREGANVTAIDIGEPAINAAKDHYEKFGTSSSPLDGKIDFRVSPVQAIESEGHQFDVVVASEVIEHVDNVENFFASLVACCKPGGSIVITTINKTSVSYAGAIVAAEQVFGWVPPGTHDWQHFVAPETLQALARKHGLDHLKTQGTTWVPFLRTFIPEPTCQVNYMISFKKPAHKD